MPKAAPISPKALPRSFSEVTSVMYACATEMLPPVMPSSMRLANSIQSEFAKPSMSSAPAVPAMLRSRTGLRPQTSERRPRNGAAMTCISGYDEKIRPVTIGDAPNSRA